MSRFTTMCFILITLFFSVCINSLMKQNFQNYQDNIACAILIVSCSIIVILRIVLKIWSFSCKVRLNNYFYGIRYHPEIEGKRSTRFTIFTEKITDNEKLKQISGLLEIFRLSAHYGFLLFQMTIFIIILSILNGSLHATLKLFILSLYAGVFIPIITIQWIKTSFEQFRFKFSIRNFESRYICNLFNDTPVVPLFHYKSSPPQPQQQKQSDTGKNSSTSTESSSSTQQEKNRFANDDKKEDEDDLVLDFTKPITSKDYLPEEEETFIGHMRKSKWFLIIITACVLSSPLTTMIAIIFGVLGLQVSGSFPERKKTVQFSFPLMNYCLVNHCDKSTEFKSKWEIVKSEKDETKLNNDDFLPSLRLPTRYHLVITGYFIFIVINVFFCPYALLRYPILFLVIITYALAFIIGSIADFDIEFEQEIHSLTLDKNIIITFLISHNRISTFFSEKQTKEEEEVVVVKKEEKEEEVTTIKESREIAEKKLLIIEQKLLSVSKKIEDERLHTLDLSDKMDLLLKETQDFLDQSLKKSEKREELKKQEESVIVNEESFDIKKNIRLDIGNDTKDKLNNSLNPINDILSDITDTFVQIDKESSTITSPPLTNDQKKLLREKLQQEVETLIKNLKKDGENADLVEYDLLSMLKDVKNILSRNVNDNDNVSNK